MRIVSIIFFFVALAGLSSCEQGYVFDGNLVMPDKEWNWRNRANFEVEIADTTRLYDLYINTRVAESFPYSNLFVLFHQVSPGGDSSVVRIDLPLFAADGKPLGLKRGNIYEYQVEVMKGLTFSKAGTYIFGIEQNMRVNTIPGVLDIGISLKNSGEKF